MTKVKTTAALKEGRALTEGNPVKQIFLFSLPLMRKDKVLKEQGLERTGVSKWLILQKKRFRNLF